MSKYDNIIEKWIIYHQKLSKGSETVVEFLKRDNDFKEFMFKYSIALTLRAKLYGSKEIQLNPIRW